MKEKILAILLLTSMLVLGSSCNTSQLSVGGVSDLYINVGVL